MQIDGRIEGRISGRIDAKLDRAFLLFDGLQRANSFSNFLMNTHD